MGGPEDEHRLVANPQLAWLRLAQKRVSKDLEALGDCLSGARTALEGGAWKGTKGDAWAHEVTGRARTLSRGADAVADDLADEIAGKPEQVCACQVVGSVLPGGLALGYPDVRPTCSR